MAYAAVDGKSFILDATQKYCPPGLTPYPLLNTYALLVDKKTTSLMTIATDTSYYRSSIQVNAKLDNTGLLTGTTDIISTGYAKQAQCEKIKDDEKGYPQKIEKENPGLTIERFSYENFNNDFEPLTQHITFKEQFDTSGAFTLVNYNLFTGFAKNPFTKTERFTNVNFGYPYLITVDETIELPTNGKVQELVSNKRLTPPGREISIAREISQTGNTIHVKLNFNQTLTVVPADDYLSLRDFYKLMVEMLSQPITIKLAK